MGVGRLLSRGLAFSGAVGLLGAASCSAILGLDELPLRATPDGGLDAAIAVPLPEAAPPVDASVVPEAGDSAPPPCDPAKLDTDPNNCGACGRVCRATCAAGACDADRLVSVPGAPRGLFVAGNAVYFGSLDGTTATIASCPVAGPCATPKIERRESADDVRLLAALPTTPPTLVFRILGRTGETSFFSCEADTCATATARRTEGGAVLDAADVSVTGLNHWIFYTTTTTAVAYSITNNFPRVLSTLAGAQVLGHNAKYLWARLPTGFQRVSLDSPTLATTTLPLTDFSDARQFVWNGGDTTIFVSNTTAATCVGASTDCVARTPCALSASPPTFASDTTSLLYGRGTELVTAPYDSPCAPQKVVGAATPALPSTGRSTALKATFAVWIETAGANSLVFRRAR